MTTNELDSVTQTLKDQEAKLLEIISELEDSIASHQSDLERIQGAIAALQQKPKPQRKKREGGGQTIGFESGCRIRFDGSQRPEPRSER